MRKTDKHLKRPVHRKIIVPWHDSLAARLATILLMVLVFLLGLAGVLAAMERPEYTRHAWVPAVFMLAGGGVATSVVIRMASQRSGGKRDSAYEFKSRSFNRPAQTRIGKKISRKGESLR